jgi:L-lactate dehydrogenase complex protein LldG
MAPATTAEFTRSLGAVGVTVTETTVADFPTALADAVEPPVVASPLPWDDLDYGDVAVAIDTDPTPGAVRDAETGVTGAAFGVADYGSVAVRSTPGGDEPVSLYPPTHVAVVRERDVLDLDDAFDRLADHLPDGDSVVFATGPSATADMGQMVQGVHGPGAVHVVLVEEP